jgi:hypothetical protein
MDPAKELALHSIVIQSPPLKQLLGRILDGYPGITLELDRLEFIAPFECFVRRWERLIAVQNELEADAESQAKLENECSDLAHLRLLRSVLYEELASILRTRQDLLKHGVMTSAHIWTIYEPGCLIYTKSDGHDRVYRLKTAKWGIANKSKHYKLECEFVDYDGDRFGFCTETINVASWKGTKKITKLEAYPLLFHDDLESMQARLSQRGRKFEAYKGFHFVGYKGVAIGKAGRGEAKLPKYDVNSRIIIDSAASNKFDGKITMEYLDTEEVYEDAVDIVGDNDEIDDDCVVLEKDSLCINVGGKMPKIEAHTRSALTTEQLLLTSPKVRGYSIRDKK